MEALIFVSILILGGMLLITLLNMKHEADRQSQGEESQRIVPFNPSQNRPTR